MCTFHLMKASRGVVQPTSQMVPSLWSFSIHSTTIMSVKLHNIFFLRRSQLLTTQAFALTEGTTHYRTEDRGKSWRPFTVPIPPALVSRPLSFHSDKTKYGYILYQGRACEPPTSGWIPSCHEEVSEMPPTPHVC